MQLVLMERFIQRLESESMPRRNSVCLGYTATIFLKTLPAELSGFINAENLDRVLEAKGFHRVMVSPKLLKENPDAVKGLVNAIARAMSDVLANPDEGVAIITNTEPLSNGELELKRLDFALENLIFSKESKANGIGAIDSERLARSIGIIKELYDLPGAPAASDVFDDSFLPPMDMRTF